MLLTILYALTGGYAAILVVAGVVLQVRRRRASRKLRERVGWYT